MTYAHIHTRIATATRLATFGDTWPTHYATDVAALLGAVEAVDAGGAIDSDRVAAIGSRIIDARGAFPWPGGRWAGWYADDAALLLEDLSVTA
jgi:hypothetical protein